MRSPGPIRYGSSKKDAGYETTGVRGEAERHGRLKLEIKSMHVRSEYKQTIATSE